VQLRKARYVCNRRPSNPAAELVESVSSACSPNVTEIKVVLKGVREYKAPTCSINFVPDLSGIVLD
jgi:hypothetical protein